MKRKHSEIVKETDFRDVFGKLKRKLSGQEFKDLVRENDSKIETFK